MAFRAPSSRLSASTLPSFCRTNKPQNRLSMRSSAVHTAPGANGEDGLRMKSVIGSAIHSPGLGGRQASMNAVPKALRVIRSPAMTISPAVKLHPPPPNLHPPAECGSVPTLDPPARKPGNCTSQVGSIIPRLTPPACRASGHILFSIIVFLRSTRICADGRVCGSCGWRPHAGRGLSARFLAPNGRSSSGCSRT
jgi:hypothetical protein